MSEQDDKEFKVELKPLGDMPRRISIGPLFDIGYGAASKAYREQIASLEASLAEVKEQNERLARRHLKVYNRAYHRGLRDAQQQLAEVKAERDRLSAALEKIIAWEAWSDRIWGQPSPRVQAEAVTQFQEKFPGEAPDELTAETIAAIALNHVRGAGG